MKFYEFISACKVWKNDAAQHVEDREHQIK